MTGYEVYSLYNSLKLHFSQKSYDFFKYQGKSRVSVDTFEKRKDKFYFHKLARKYPNYDDMLFFLVSNFVENDNVWVGNLLGEEYEEKYKLHRKVYQSLSYVFENECLKIFEDCENPNDVLKTDGDYPILLVMALRKEISIETLCVLNSILNFLPMWDKKITDTIRWPEYKNKIEKFTCFLPKDVIKYKLILKKILS